MPTAEFFLLDFRRQFFSAFFTLCFVFSEMLHNAFFVYSFDTKL